MFIYVFITGLIMAQYTITGFDASAHMSEETRKASLAAAWGMVMAVVVSVIFGFILLVAVTFAIPGLSNDDLVGARMMFAFSRDGAVPGHKLWRRVPRPIAYRSTRSGVSACSHSH